MTQTKWDKIADLEFNSMDEEARDQWSDLRARTR